MPENVTNEMLIELLFPEEYQKTVLYAVPDYAYIHGELAKKGVNLTILWEEYSAKCQTEGSVPYMYSYFCEKYGRWANVTKATMRIQHKPGDTMAVQLWISIIRSPVRSARRTCSWLSCPAAALPMRKSVTI